MGWIAPTCPRCAETAARRARLEKVAELARMVADEDRPADDAGMALRLALAELDGAPG